jgi:hypothetical protein
LTLTEKDRLKAHAEAWKPHVRRRGAERLDSAPLQE